MTDYKQPSVLRDVPSAASAHTNYHELPEVLRRCKTCKHLSGQYHPRSNLHLHCKHPDNAEDDVAPITSPDAVCSHWERRND